MLRRNFLKISSQASLALSPTLAWDKLTSIKNLIQNYPPKASYTRDEDFWKLVRQAYTVSPAIINLNNGGVSPQPRTVQEAQDRYQALANETPSYYMWRILNQNREPIRERLARMAGCDQEEIAIQRNATEALNTAIFGMDLEKGDEVVLSRQDYPNMVHAWKQRAQRDGIVLKWVNLELPLENAEEITQLYSQLFTKKTKVVHLTHMINWTGQILPVREIADRAKAQKIKVVVDAAHSFAHLDFKIPDLQADYLGTSLHKWLCAPFGTGMLYVKKENIQALWPLHPHHEPQSDNIRKFENLGTRSYPAEMAIGQALDFQELIGIQRKQARLQYLKNYWVEKCLDIPGFKINTSLKPEFACALANFSLGKWDVRKLNGSLLNRYKIHGSPVIWENIEGLRITPHVYTTIRELDKLVAAIQELAQEENH